MKIRAEPSIVVAFDKGTLAAAKAAAASRREEAIDVLVNTCPPWSQADAEAKNPLSSHIKGELTERAVEFWLQENNIECSRPENRYEEMFHEVPDLTVQSSTVAVDVKSRVVGAFCTYSNPKPREDLAVFWCKLRESAGDFSEAVLLGWARSDEVANSGFTDEMSGNAPQLLVQDLRHPDDLLYWIRTGTCLPRK